MTLVAVFGEDFPVVFGDLLITGPNDPNSRVTTPARGEVQEFFGTAGWGVSGLTQKVSVIHDSCAIAWSGSWLGARIAIAGLRSMAQSGPLTIDAVFSFLQSHPDLARHPASFVGMLRHHDGLQTFCANAERQTLPTLGRVYTSGSGAGAVAEFDNLLAGVAVESPDPVRVPEHSIARGLMLGGLLLNSELRGGDAATTIRNCFGGGYELAYFHGGRAQKPTEVTFVVWEASITTTAPMLSHPLLIVKQQYAGDYLLIRSARMASTDLDPVPHVVDEQRQVIPPMFDSDKPDMSRLALPSFNSSVLCHCVAIRRGPAQVGLYTLVQRFAPESAPTVAVEEHHDGISIRLDESVTKTLFDAVESLRGKR